ncbi:DUF2125 domain-containing protein [Roseobacter litoralis]|uniref:DUF2125 domain-containing protein n=1 Tax=Roseobacter litoralis TaxID=42443 RepID=UPI002494031F|nr:DUF2125 domain-containing protein [Roseobacter litoralis]
MPRIMRRFMASTALVLIAPAAFAELSADDVWSDWKTYISGLGYSVTGQETRAGDVLTVTGVAITSGDASLGGGSISMDRVVLTERADGTVTVALPTVMPFEMATPNDTGSITRVSADYRQTGLSIVASGTPNDLQYDYSAQTVSLESTGFEVNGQVLPAQSNAFVITLDDIAGTTDMVLDAHRRYTQDMEIGAARYALKASDAASGGSSDMSGQMQSVTFDGQSTLPLRAVDTNNVEAMLAAGFTAGGTFNYAANALTLNVTSPTGPSDASVIGQSGRIGVTLGPDGLTYDAAQDDMQVEMTSPQFPLPINFNVAQTAMNIAMPIRKSEAPDDFALGFTLDGFTMSDMLWGLFDPGGQLPRDPATIALDLAGKARLMFNFLDPSVAAEIDPGTAPAEIDKLDINRMQITVAGAELVGNGAFEFDNSAEGAPKPEGAVDLTLTGANGLIDKLVAGGLLPEEQAMGARMMMGLLAVPGNAPDTLNSKIEINDQGHVMANGQRIQ